MRNLNLGAREEFRMEPVHREDGRLDVDPETGEVREQVATIMGAPVRIDPRGMRGKPRRDRRNTRRPDPSTSDRPDPLSDENQRLAVGMAKQFRDHGVEIGDLVQEAQLALVEACANYDPSRRMSFNTYAKYHIRQGLFSALAKRHLVSIPYQVYRTFKKINRGELQESDIPKAIRERVDDVRTFFDRYRNHMRDHWVKDGNLSEIVPDPDAESIGMEFDPTLMNFLTTVNFQLDERELAVLRGRLGIDGHAMESYEHLGKRLGINRSTLQWTEKRIIHKLKCYFGLANGVLKYEGSKKVGDANRRHVGVYHQPSYTKSPWKAMIYVEGRLMTIGSFPTEESAVAAYDAEARKLGRPVNFPREGEEQAVAGKCGGKRGKRGPKSKKVAEPQNGHEFDEG